MEQECENPDDLNDRRNSVDEKVGVTELESVSNSSGKTLEASESGAESGALLSESGAESGALLSISDPGLALVVVKWPDLPLHSRRIIVGMARKAAERVEAARTCGRNR